ncbi:DUF3883 domain-containing protein [Microbacterium sp. APC 3898]|uniref:DUF3883 domain-containing protein n=1 Tax=Planococcus notacanthi TaxID=3035188 RepID=A0ABT7ZJW5_9BACL|nr:MULTISPECIES: DUF3883 domain-containing protein [Terrabacteria group]MDN3427444.1 DUF3883 domain-containing protein [Planococcus sp. APC 4016]MDN3498996.1 DUF3883 domain-containing protein [Microbacterium sp. APC 3898]
MPINLKNHKSYLELKYIKMIFIFLENNSCNIAQLKNFFRENKKISLEIDDTLSLLVFADLIHIQSDGKLIGKKNYEESNIIKKILWHLSRNKIAIINKNKEEYDLFISYPYYAIRNFLITSKVIESKNRNNYQVKPGFENMLEDILDRKVSQLQLEKTLINKAELGKKAELYVIEYEQKKFPEKIIEHIAIDDVSAGFDIKSYIDIQSMEFDKFIEVKCISERDVFYWSRNEIETARLLGNNYSLYFVNSSFDEEPVEVINPYEKLYLNKSVPFTEETRSYTFSVVSQLEL